MSNKIRFSVQIAINANMNTSIYGINGAFMPKISFDSPTSKTEFFSF